MAGEARMAFQGPLGLRDAKVTWEKRAAQEYQVRSFGFSSFPWHSGSETVDKIPGLLSVCLR